MYSDRKWIQYRLLTRAILYPFFCLAPLSSRNADQSLRLRFQSLISVLAALPGLRLISSSRRRSSDIQVIEVQRGVEKHRKAAVRLMAPHRVVGEHYDVPFANRDVDHRRLAGQFTAAGEHPANKQALFIGGESQNDARAHLGRRQLPCELCTELFGDPVFTRRSGRLWRQRPAALYDVGIAHAAAS